MSPDRQPSQPAPAREAADDWPAWFGPAGFVLGAIGSLVASALLVAVTGATTDAPGVALVATLGQDAALVAAAVLLAATVRRPRPSDLGLRPAPARRAIAAFGIGALVFYGFAAAYEQLFSPNGKQDIVESLGVDENIALLLGAGLLLVIVAPYAEELFFRGFFYRAARNRVGAAGATIAVGVLFGLIHYSGPQTLPLLPVLGAFGALLCVVYQVSGSLYPAIALHALNNALAFGATGAGAGVPVVAGAAGVVALGSCLLLPRAQARRFGTSSRAPAR